jgi:type I restriction enzyme M protein
MAVRPVYLPKTSWPYYSIENITFKFSAGFALVQRQKNISAIHEGYKKLHPKSKLLEASSKSDSALGKSLSPFYLKTLYEGKLCPVENIFQSCKVFMQGGPYLSLLDMEPVKAKTTSLTKNSGPLLYYEYENHKYPLDPKGWLFEWIYLKALQEHTNLTQEILAYNGFTDIAFSPRTGITCQAQCLAIYIGLQKKGLLDAALENIPSFLKIVYHAKWNEVQMETALTK